MLSRRTLTTILVTLSLFAGGIAPVAAASTSNTPAASAPPITVTDTVTQTVASEDLQRTTLAHLGQSAQWKELFARVADLETTFEALSADALNKPELINSIELDRRLNGLYREVTDITDSISSVVRRLERDDNLLEASAKSWQDRATYLESQSVPPAVLERAQSIKTKLQQAKAKVRIARDDALIGLNRALSLQTRLEEARALVAARQDLVDERRMQLASSPIWNLGDAELQLEFVWEQTKSTWGLQRDYLAQDGAGLMTLFFLIFVASCWLFKRRGGVFVEPSQRAYGRPYAASLLVALVALGWAAPNPPRLFFEALFLLAPIPAAMVAMSAIRVPIPLTIYGIAASTSLIALRALVDSSPVAFRILLLIQVLLTALPVAIDLRRGHLREAFPAFNEGSVRAFAVLILASAAVTTAHLVFGFTGVSATFRAGTGSFLGCVLVFGTLAVVLDGMARALLATPVMQWFHSARSADRSLLRSIRLIIRAFAIVNTVIVTVGSLGLELTVNTLVDSMMSASLEVGTASIAFKSVVMGLAVIAATFISTGIVSFILSREILPRLRLSAGACYAIVTFTRWAMLITGGALTLAALGINTSNITLLAGALSVGIGFGLQNVINNFVSGLILIIERPIGVGDVIEWGSETGTITHIGIRSSTVRTEQGAEILVPNGDLVSKDVVNWTRSDRRRRYDVDVAVDLGAEPERVMQLLVAAAADVPGVLKLPAPHVVFKRLGDSSLTFTLRAWVETVDQELPTQNALHVAMLKKLERAGIAPFAQHDGAQSSSAPAAGAAA